MRGRPVDQPAYDWRAIWAAAGWSEESTPGGFKYWTDPTRPGIGYVEDPDNPGSWFPYPIFLIDFIMAPPPPDPRDTRQTEVGQGREFTAGPLGKIPIVYGEVRVGGNLFYLRRFANRMYFAYALSHGPCHALSAFDVDKDVTAASVGTQYNFYRGLLDNSMSADPYLFEARGAGLGGVTALTSTQFPRWPGRCYVAGYYPMDTPFIPGMPDPTFLLQGRELYLPWNGTTAYSKNPSLIIADYLAKSYGLGVGYSGLVTQSFQDAYDYYEEQVMNPYTGLNEPRFAINIMLAREATHKANIDTLRAHCRASIIPRGNLLAIVVDKPAVFAMTFTSDDTRAGTVRERATSETALRVDVKFPDPEKEGNETTVSAEASTALTNDMRRAEYVLEGCYSSAMAYRQAWYLLNSGLNSISGAIDIARQSALKLEPMDVVRVTNNKMGLVAQDIRIKRISKALQDYSVEFEIYNPAIYADVYMPVETKISSDFYTPYNEATPADVTGLTLTEESYSTQASGPRTRIKAAWTNPSGNDFGGAQVEYSLDAGTTYIRLARVESGPVYIDPAQEGQSYIVRVKSIKRSTQAANSVGPTASIMPLGIKDWASQPAPPLSVAAFASSSQHTLYFEPTPQVKITENYGQGTGGTGAWSASGTGSVGDDFTKGDESGAGDYTDDAAYPYKYLYSAFHHWTATGGRLKLSLAAARQFRQVEIVMKDADYLTLKPNLIGATPPFTIEYSDDGTTWRALDMATDPSVFPISAQLLNVTAADSRVTAKWTDGSLGDRRPVLYRWNSVGSHLYWAVKCTNISINPLTIYEARFREWPYTNDGPYNGTTWWTATDIAVADRNLFDNGIKDAAATWVQNKSVTFSAASDSRGTRSFRSLEVWYSITGSIHLALDAFTIEYSDNGTTWTGIQGFQFSYDIIPFVANAADNRFRGYFPDHGEHRFWRVKYTGYSTSFSAFEIRLRERNYVPDPYVAQYQLFAWDNVADKITPYSMIAASKLPTIIDRVNVEALGTRTKNLVDGSGSGSVYAAVAAVKTNGNLSVAIKNGSNWAGLASLTGFEYTGATVRASSGTSIAAAFVGYAISFAAGTVVQCDSGGFWNSGSPTRLTVPAGKGGLYTISGGAEGGTTGTFGLWFKINGSDAQRLNGFTGSDLWMHTLAIQRYLNAGDYVELFAITSGAAPFSIVAAEISLKRDGYLNPVATIAQ